VIYGTASVSTIARLILDEKKADEKIELRGIFFDGEVYVGDKGVEQVSKLPTREEAIGQVVALILSPGQRLGGIFKGQAGKIAALIKAVEERAEKSGAGAAPAAEAAPAPAAAESAPAT
jgi:large subunit ribosomal protein L10